VSRISHFTGRRRIAIIIFWALLVLAASPFAQRQGERLTSGGFEAPGSQSARAAQVMAKHFPAVTVEGLALLVEGSPTATAADYREALARVQNDAPRGAGVSLSTVAQSTAADRLGMSLSPVARRRMEGLTHGGQRAILPIEVHTSVRETIDDAAAVFKKLKPESAQSGPVSVRFVGRPVQVAVVHELSESDAKHSESLAFPLVLIVLIVIFGSLTAALLPVVLGLSSVVLTGAVIYGLSRQLVLSVFVINISSLLGIGVAIDYSLFMLVRYREEIARGANHEEAREAMLRTSGRAVVLAGGTVVLSLVSLFLIKNTILRSMAGGAIIVVAISVAVATIVLPSLIAILGDRLVGRSRLLVAASERLGFGGRTPFWERWVAGVMRRPVSSALLSGALLLALSAPVLAIRLGTDTLRQLPRDSRTRQATEVAARLQGPDADSPVLVTAAYPSPGAARANRESMLRARELLTADGEVRSVTPLLSSTDGRAYALMATLRHDPESNSAVDTVNRLRRVLPRQMDGAGQAALAVGGTTATVIDAGEEISDSLWKVIAAVLILSYLSLFVMLKSVVLPLKAAVMNLLSVGAAMGVLVMIFQLGWLSSLFGTESLGHIEIYVPPLVFAVVYGLSMDYEVFLLTRIQERYRATGDNRRAVAEGVSSSARTISCAALIMVLVFAAFIATSEPIVQEIGLGAAVAVAIDATVTRLVLLPATMALLGRWNWWMPDVLARSGHSRRAPSPPVGEEAQ
jgi:uncharacterized membrane protein YdfJ with MMPL/SSD domain